jgi:leucyl aminopeptidase
MKVQLKFASPVTFATAMLAVFAADSSASKEKNAPAKPILLTRDTVFAKADKPALESGEFNAGRCETLLLHGTPELQAKRLLIVGLGKAAKVTVDDVRRGAGAAVRFAKPRGIRELAILLPEHDGLDLAAATQAAVEGAFVGDYDPDTYRSDRKDRSIEQLTILAPQGADKSAVEKAFREGVVLGESQNFTRELVNEPGNRLTPTILGQRAAAMCKEQGLACEVYSTDKLHELKMGAFWSVAKGSDEPPALVVMRYEPETAPKDGPVLALVGKGITFDTGGISLKPSDNMEKMKYDMAGAAAMLGAMRAIAQLKPNVRVMGILCSAENMPSGKAYKPGDVAFAMSGKTIEIINTDAEGRLVLADGLHYAKQLGATHLIDAATLTGACVVALGMLNAGLFSNDEEACERFRQAAQRAGEKFWRLPLDDEYRDMIVSDIGDIKNTGGRWGGAITAAMFLKEFAGDTPWVHLDIAGVAWMEENKPWIARGPSGIAVRSVVEWVRSYAG